MQLKLPAPAKHTAKRFWKKQTWVAKYRQ